MFNDCFFCGNSYGYDALEKKHLHKVGKYLVCHLCLTELEIALESQLSRTTGLRSARMGFESQLSILQDD